ncbi:MAG: PHP domain-containing protein [Polyangiaceae bacterium]|nr:PHP domain-containing protein [Polyangiaceae bacterium]MCW5790945.1 PHP domain-containing protein [Polyangiaceae bacterium]
MSRLAWLLSCIGLSCSAPPPEVPERHSTLEPSAAEPSAAEPSAAEPPQALPEQPATTPPSPPERFLKGQLHVHSSGSYDAEEPPEAILRFYAERGYDFVAISDHNHVTKPSEVPDGMLWVPAVELTQNAASCTPGPPPGYRCLFHTGGLFLADTAPRHVRLPYRPARFAAYQQQLEWTAAHGGLSVIYHPSFHFAADARLLTRLAREGGARLFEVSNAALDGQHPAGPARAEQRSEALWDAVLGAGVTLYGVATDDAHHFSQAKARARSGRAVYGGDKGYVRVRAEPSLGSLRRALAAGDFYASTGVELSRLTVSAERVTFDIHGGTAPWSTRFVGAGGRLLHEQQGASASYEPRGDEGYVRAVVTDAKGLRAWIQPVFLAEAAAATP